MRFPGFRRAMVTGVSLVVVATAVAGPAPAQALASGGTDPATSQAAPRHLNVTAAAAEAKAHPRPQHPAPKVHRLPHGSSGKPVFAPAAGGSLLVPLDPKTRKPLGGTKDSVKPATPQAAPAAAVAGPPYTALFLDGEIGQTIMKGEVITRTPPDTFGTQVPDQSTVYVSVESASGAYSLELVAPDGAALTTGTYTNAIFPAAPRAPGQPGMFVGAHSTSCEGTGNFTITELGISGSTLTSLAASFSYQCPGPTPGSLQTQKILGEVRYQSTQGLKAMDVSPWPASLGNIAVGRTATEPVKIANPGTTSLKLGAMAVTGSGTRGTDSCSGATLAPGASCTVSVVLSPSSAGAMAAALKWTDDSVRGSHEVDVTATAIIELDVAIKGGAVGAAVDVLDQTCTDSCVYDATAYASTGVLLEARPPVGYTLAAWSGACTGTGPCLLTLPTSRSVTATFAPVLASGASSLRAVDGVAGYRDGEFGCSDIPCLEPPDPVVAVNASQVVAATNGTLRITTRAGTLLGDLPLWAFFLEDASTIMGGDPQVVWDAVHARWLASEFSASCDMGYVAIAISDGADAAAGWTVYEFSTPNAILDFPGLGLSSDKAAIGGNLFDLNSGTCEIDQFRSGELLVLPLASMLAGGSVSGKSFDAPTSSSLRPAVVLDNTADLPVVMNTQPFGGTDLVDIAYAVVHGSGSAMRLGPVHDLSQRSLLGPYLFGPPLAATIDPPIPAGFPAATENLIDGRPLEAWVRGGDLWMTSDTGCTPTGDTAMRACARVTRVHLRAGYEATPSGAEVVPAPVNPAASKASVWVLADSASGPLRYQVRWTNYYDPVSQPRADIHYGAPGANGPVMFYLCGKPGTITGCSGLFPFGGTLKASDFQASAQVATFAAAVAAVQAGQAYVEVYSDYGYPDALQRGQLRPTSVADRLVFDDVIGSKGEDRFLPALGFATDGTAYLTYARSAASRISAQVTWAATSDAAGTFQAPAEVSRGPAAYRGTRWGDYFRVARDPADGHGVWLAGQFVTPTGDWQAWSTHVVAGATGAAAGTITINGGATSTTYPDVLLTIRGTGGPATEALVSNSPTLSGGALATGRRIAIGSGIRWSLIEAAVGGTATTGTKRVYVQFGDGLGAWGSVTSAVITLAANPSISRFAGADRYATSAAISAGSFQPGARIVFIATGTNFPDALAGAAVAGRIGAPVLLVKPTSIPAPILAELARLKADRVVILGGTGAVSASVANALRPFARGGVYRIFGSDRYATAASVAYQFFSPGVPIAFIATGANFPDALAGGAAAGKTGSPILLVSTGGIPTATANALRYLAPKRIVILGGSGVVSSTVATKLARYTSGSVTRLAGADRYSTTAAISRAFFGPGTPAAFVATGPSFPDALSGAGVAGSTGGPIILVAPNAIPAASATELNRLNPKRIVILGGTGAVSAGVALQLGAYVTP